MEAQEKLKIPIYVGENNPPNEIKLKNKIESKLRGPFKLPRRPDHLMIKYSEETKSSKVNIDCRAIPNKKFPKGCTLISKFTKKAADKFPPQ